MSKYYNDNLATATQKLKAITTSKMREYCSRPGKKDENGKPVYFTEQHHKDTCDVNKIITKYDKTGLIIHANTMEAQYGDMTGMDYKEALDKVMEIRNDFNLMPSKIRKRFNNNPEEYLRFMENPANRDEAIKLGLVLPGTPENLDGLGEHVTEEMRTSESTTNTTSE